MLTSRSNGFSKKKSSRTEIVRESVYAMLRRGINGDGGGDEIATLGILFLSTVLDGWENHKNIDQATFIYTLSSCGVDERIAQAAHNTASKLVQTLSRDVSYSQFTALAKKLDLSLSTIRWVSRNSFGIRPMLGWDLFAGAGGMSLGFSRVGFDIVQAIESDLHAVATYALNHPSTEIISADISTLDPATCMLIAGVKPGEIDVLFGGPPCQGFSESNRRSRNVSNPRNYLYREMIRFANLLRPKWIVIENVVGLRTVAAGAFLQSIENEIRAIKYNNISTFDLNAADFGVPQSRRRTFIIAGSDGVYCDPPVATYGRKQSYVTVAEAIDDLPKLKNGDRKLAARYTRDRNLSSFQKDMRKSMETFITGNIVTKNAQYIIERYRHVKQGQNWEAIPPDLMRNYFDRSRCHTDLYFRLPWDQPARVVANFRKAMIIHPQQHRGLSVREAARLQSFPDSYKFVGSIGFQQQQIANAVPPKLAEAVALALSNTNRNHR